MEKAYTMAEEPYTRIYARIDLDAIVKIWRRCAKIFRQKRR
ncbi:MAG: hypothetical protein ACLR3S_11025 [Clostridium fessum]